MALVELVLQAKQAPVGDFVVSRALPQRERRIVGPFCFVDHMGPHESVGTAQSGVGPHPHIGLSTVTYLFEGEVLHRDSLGTEQRITPGDVNLMTAGRGIVHSERTPADRLGQRARMHGLQTWLALPLSAEEGDPSFQHAPKASLPLLDDTGVSGRLLLGEWAQLRSPVRLTSPTVYLVADLEPGAQLELPTQYAERAVYVVDGDVSLEGTSFARGALAVLSRGVSGCVSANTQARIAVLGGEPLEGPRFMSWNFVSSRKERLAQAAADWRAGRFPPVPGDDGPRIELP